VISAVAARDFPRQGLPEIAVAGRSNVGKSSLINALTGCRNLARTSTTPGKTRMINFYRLEGAWLLVDLPGYGYARVPKAESRQWKQLVNDYFAERTTVALVIRQALRQREGCSTAQDLRSVRRKTGNPVLGTNRCRVQGDLETGSRSRPGIISS
jgi:ribosome biogenesis GTP-binding protein YsxC/EngB